MRAVDTNVLVRLAVRDEARQVEAAEAFIASGAWVSQLVLLEFVWVLTSVYDFGRADVASAVEILLNHAQLTIEDSDVVEVALGQFRKTRCRELLGLSGHRSCQKGGSSACWHVRSRTGTALGRSAARCTRRPNKGMKLTKFG